MDRDPSLNPFTDAPYAAWIWTQSCRCVATAFFFWEPVGIRRELLGHLCWIAEMK